MGGGDIPPAEPMSSVLSSYTQYLPGLVSATAAQMPNIAQNQLNATLATQPLYNALNLQQAQNYAVPLAQVGQDVTRSNALAGAETNLAQIYGPGGAAALAAADLSRAANPNYYNIQDASSRQAVNMLNAINMNGLSPGEQNAVERSLNQANQATGNLGNANALNTIGNAMNFGDRYNAKIGQLGTALGAANQTATSAQNTGFSPVNIALGQPNTSTMGNFGTGTFSNTNAATQNASGSNAFNFGSSMLGNMTSGNNALISANASTANANSPAALMSGIGGLMGGCCFIMLEAHYGVLPLHVRRCRDKYYSNFPDIATGYKRMASWLVPLMRRFKLVRELVWHTMVHPLTEYGHFVLRHNSSARKYKIARKFWFSVWNLIGKA